MSPDVISESSQILKLSDKYVLVVGDECKDGKHDVEIRRVTSASDDPYLETGPFYQSKDPNVDTSLLFQLSGESINMLRTNSADNPQAFTAFLESISLESKKLVSRLPYLENIMKYLMNADANEMQNVMYTFRGEEQDMKSIYSEFLKLLKEIVDSLNTATLLDKNGDIPVSVSIIKSDRHIPGDSNKLKMWREGDVWIVKYGRKELQVGTGYLPQLLMNVIISASPALSENVRIESYMPESV